MKGSESAILTTHAGSLLRPVELVDLQLRVSYFTTCAPCAQAPILPQRGSTEDFQVRIRRARRKVSGDNART